MDLSHILEYEMEIKARYIELIVMAYRDMQNQVTADLTNYVIQILSVDGILHLRFSNPNAPSRFPFVSREYPILNYQIDIESGKIIRITGER